MSEHPTFDRAKGFVALPVEILELELSPGAFRLLVELCRMANREGYCWPSLAQLSERLGRSRSAISGYIRDLREEDLIKTEEQKTANGYNYRLKYFVTFWPKWRADVSASTGAKAERSVQQTECLKKENQIHINQAQSDLDSSLTLLVSGWAKCFKGSSYPSVSQIPDQRLVEKTEAFLARNTDQANIISADIVSELSKLWSALGVAASKTELICQSDALKSMGYLEPQRTLILQGIQSKWPTHWRRLPDDEQFKKLVLQTKIPSPNAQRDVLRGYLKRWKLAQKTLLRSPLSDCVSRKSTHPSLMAAQ